MTRPGRPQPKSPGLSGDSKALTELKAIFPTRLSLRPREVCDTLGIGPTLFYALAKQGKLKVRKIGKVTIVTLFDLAEYLDGRCCEKAG